MIFSPRACFALVFLAAGARLPAATATEGSIEQSIRQSYNFRTVLANHVIVKAHHRQVTLSGSVAQPEDALLALDTAENTPGVFGVTDQISVRPPRYTEGSDPWIANRIRSRILGRAGARAITTTVFVREGIATLGGTAANEPQKEVAAACARETTGVVSIRNNIVVQDELAAAETIDDASITALVKLALRRHPSTRALNPAVSTAEGVVRIAGAAGSEAGKSLVTTLAREIRGVASVTNDMSVNRPAVTAP